MLIFDQGTLVRYRVAEVSSLSRNHPGCDADQGRQR